MNEITQEAIEEVMQIYREYKDMTMSEAIEIYKAVQLKKIASACYIDDEVVTFTDLLEEIRGELDNLTDENGIQYVKGEIAPCAY